MIPPIYDLPAFVLPTFTLIVFLFPLAFSPGPGNMFFAASGASFGFRATLAAILGYHLATWVVTFAIGLGFSAVRAQGPALFAAMRWAGSAYVLFLASRFLRAGAVGDSVLARPAGLAGGAMLLILNPKAYVIIALMFSQFLDGGDASAGTGSGDRGAVAWITTVFTLNNLVAFMLWTLAGDWLAARLRSEVAARRLNIGFGIILAGVALWMLLG